MEDANARYFADADQKGMLGSRKLVEPNQQLGFRGEYVKMLNLTIPTPEMVDIHLRTEYGTIPDGQPNAGTFQIGGPFVARVRWGVGGASQVIEFDVPSVNNPANFAPGVGIPPAEQPFNEIGNGVVFSASGSAFEVQIRNDARLQALNGPNPATGVIGFALQIFQNPAIGAASGFKQLGIPAIAFITPHGDSKFAPLQRSIYVVGAANGTPNTPLLPANTVQITIPSWAKNVKFLRFPIATTPLNAVTFDNNANIWREFNVGVNEVGPVDLFGAEQTILVTNNGAVNITSMIAVFDVTP
jgi:hypothetical protein